MQIIRDIDQGTDEWLDARLGYITASRFKDVMAAGQGKTRSSYMRQIAAEILTGMPEPSYTNNHIEHGNETEDQARAMYELTQCEHVDQIAFARFDDINIGCSPDGLVGSEGLVEFKCPKTTTQIETYLSGKMPSIHKAQVQGQMWVMDRAWCDFVSFDPRINGESSYFCLRIKRDDEYIDKIKHHCADFLEELDQMMEKLASLHY